MAAAAAAASVALLPVLSSIFETFAGDSLSFESGAACWSHLRLEDMDCEFHEAGFQLVFVSRGYRILSWAAIRPIQYLAVYGSVAFLRCKHWYCNARTHETLIHWHRYRHWQLNVREDLRLIIQAFASSACTAQDKAQ